MRRRLCQTPSSRRRCSLACSRVPAPQAPRPRQRLIAPASACPGQTSRRPGRRAGAGDALHDQLRPPPPRPRGSSADSAELDRSAAPQVRATSSAATASATTPAAATSPTGCERVGYIRGCWRAGENIAWGSGRSAPCARSSAPGCTPPGHRENILGRLRARSGSARVGGLEGYARRPRLDPALRRPLLSDSADAADARLG